MEGQNEFHLGVIDEGVNNVLHTRTGETEHVFHPCARSAWTTACPPVMRGMIPSQLNLACPESLRAQPADSLSRSTSQSNM